METFIVENLFRCIFDSAHTIKPTDCELNGIEANFSHVCNKMGESAQQK